MEYVRNHVSFLRFGDSLKAKVRRFLCILSHLYACLSKKVLEV
jgi:hypothetical protein